MTCSAVEARVYQKRYEENHLFHGCLLTIPGIMADQIEPEPLLRGDHLGEHSTAEQPERNSSYYDLGSGDVPQGVPPNLIQIPYTAVLAGNLLEDATCTQQLQQAIDQGCLLTYLYSEHHGWDFGSFYSRPESDINPLAAVSQYWSHRFA